MREPTAEELLLIKNSIKPIREVWQQAKYELQNPPLSIKLDLWPMLTEITGGLRMKEFTVFCGATGGGKTSINANLSAQLLAQRIPHFVASVETGHTDFAKRVASVLIDRDINDGSAYTAEQVAEFDSAVSYVMNSDDLQLSLFDNRIPSDLLIGKLRYANEELGCKVALLDNLNFFLQVTRSQDQIIEMDRVIHDLIMFSKRANMHVVLVMHPKKTEGGRITSEFDIKGSSTAVQEAFNVVLLNRLDPEFAAQRGYGPFHRELIIAKLRRRGRYVGKRLIWDGSTPAYREVEIV